MQGQEPRLDPRGVVPILFTHSVLRMGVRDWEAKEKAFRKVVRRRRKPFDVDLEEDEEEKKRSKHVPGSRDKYEEARRKRNIDERKKRGIREENKVIESAGDYVDQFECTSLNPSKILRVDKDGRVSTVDLAFCHFGVNRGKEFLKLTRPDPNTNKFDEDMNFAKTVAYASCGNRVPSEVKRWRKQTLPSDEEKSVCKKAVTKLFEHYGQLVLGTALNDQRTTAEQIRDRVFAKKMKRGVFSMAKQGRRKIRLSGLGGSFLDGVVPYKTLGTKELGVFRECARDCGPGLEKVEVEAKVERIYKRGKNKGKKYITRGVCICRLSYKNRIKNRDKDIHSDINWRNRKPFKKKRTKNGPPTENVHLRRCEKFEVRGGKEVCVKKGPPIIVQRD